MVPAAVVDGTVHGLANLLQKDDIIIDGGNSYYIDDIRRAKELAPKGIHYVDVGTSGGVWGLERGYCLMIGGEEAVVKHLDPIFATLAPGAGQPAAHAGTRAGRRHRRAGLPALRAQRRRPLRQNGAQRHRIRHYGRLRRGAWRFCTMPTPASRIAPIDAETTPMRHPEYYQYDLESGRHRGSLAPRQRDRLVAVGPDGGRPGQGSRGSPNSPGRVSDSGEGRWTIKAAIDEAVPVPVLSTALYQRFTSRGEADFQDRLLSAMRFGFGGHLEKPAK